MTWKKGQSGNPGGRSKQHRKLERLAVSAMMKTFNERPNPDADPLGYQAFRRFRDEHPDKFCLAMLAYAKPRDEVSHEHTHEGGIVVWAAEANTRVIEHEPADSERNLPIEHPALEDEPGDVRH